MKTNRINFDSYSQVESLESFKDGKELDSYRNERLSKYREYVNFFQNHSEHVNGLRVVEIGSGSSALLYAMEQRGLLLESVGIDASLSRYKFAEKWKEDWGFTKVKNVNNEFMKVSLSKNYYDLYLVVDNTFSYLYPESREFPFELLRQAYNCLKKGGFLVIEISNYTSFLVTHDQRTWVRLPPSNPFRYALYHKSYLQRDNLVKSESIYISREGQEKSKIELSYVYNVDSLSRLLSESRFKVKGIYCNFNSSPFIQEDSPCLIVIARKLS